MKHEPQVVVRVGQVWHLLYGGEKVRMRVASISRDGGVVLVEDKPHRDWIRVLSTSASGLFLSGEIAPSAVDEDEPLTPSEDVTQVELVRPVFEDEPS